jgi:excisionase family DNA binding protein
MVHAGAFEFAPCHRAAQEGHGPAWLEQRDAIGHVRVADHEPALAETLHGTGESGCGSAICADAGGESVDDSCPIGIGLQATKEVAERFGVCTATVYAMCKRGELRHVRVGNSIRVAQSELDSVAGCRLDSK